MFDIDVPIRIPLGHTLKGINKSSSILKANELTWKFNIADEMI